MLDSVGIPPVATRLRLVSAHTPIRWSKVPLGSSELRKYSAVGHAGGDRRLDRGGERAADVEVAEVDEVDDGLERDQVLLRDRVDLGAVELRALDRELVRGHVEVLRVDPERRLVAEAGAAGLGPPRRRCRSCRSGRPSRAWSGRRELLTAMSSVERAEFVFVDERGSSRTRCWWRRRSSSGGRW